MEHNKIGVWIIGALGAIASTVITGAMALKKRLISPTGMITATDLFDGIELAAVDDLEFGGCDIRKCSLRDSVHHFSRETRAIDPWLIHEIEAQLDEVQDNILLGVGRNCGEAILRLADSEVTRERSLKEEVAEIRANLREFRGRNALRDLVVVNLASTEPPLQLSECHQSLEALEACLENNDVPKVKASTLYAYSAIREGCPYINFTPSNAALVPAVIQLARECGVPVMGNDGKTGETLVKSALAPLFLYRNLEVLSWEGFNILGNMDGQVLDHPQNRESKVKTKDQVLGKILGYAPHSKVRIDYVPSLDDQKTAWDFIHFKGFLGAKMSLQFIWQGYDSILAAPLILDLVRLAALAKEHGEAGLMPHLACFFKAPMGVDEYRLAEQFQLLGNYVASLKKHRLNVELVK